MWRMVTVGATASASDRVGALGGVNQLFTPAYHGTDKINPATDEVSATSRVIYWRRTMSDSQRVIP